jgi:hypothetical protein
LIITLPKEAFIKWGLHFVGPIKLVGWSNKENIYILVIIDYVIKWVEAKALHTNIVVVTLLQLYLNSYMSSFLTRFGCPLTRVTYQGVHFINDVITYWTNHFKLKHVNSTTYYPHGNGQVESTNNVIGRLITKLVW